MQQNEMIQLLQKTGDKLKNKKLERMIAVNPSNTQFTQQFLQQQLDKSNTQKKGTLLTQNELNQAIKKFQEYITKNQDAHSLQTYQKSQESENMQDKSRFKTINFDTSSSKKVQSKHSHKLSHAIPTIANDKPQPQHFRQSSDIIRNDGIVDKLYDSLMSRNAGNSKPITPKCGTFQFPQFSDDNQELTNANLEEIYYIQKVKQAIILQNQNDYFTRLYRNHFKQLCQELSIGIKLKPANYTDIKTKGVKLDKQNKYKDSITLIFDLDETLIHCNERDHKLYDAILTVNLNKTQQVQAKINVRPNAVEILRKLSENFELIVFTASNKIYAKSVIDYLDPNKDIFAHRLYRESCILTSGGIHVKDLRILNRNLEKVAIIDNSACNFSWQIDNGIPIIPFYDNQLDDELNHLYKYLSGMRECNDVREYNRKHLQLYRYTGNINQYQNISRQMKEQDYVIEDKN
ncbi:unnamed protein product (macronuclear) [Paramecium tetraurelia]|uniref:FCP1 homology domain-containing protein n=1 Tax=Paramecium tetraurelia TaxID=5888 RepID=A0DHN8_PARTE|nr:uncharacterized protein GSPATT00016942001 [Paramecium tetraurelia]CAK82555.1 unnamed protein product [Paramecium tetraurelia]|eukprot:XP_001449952.1 hypothetical protein (macronuclear) [Paramecium tetraurelia strain d4-2]